MDVALLILDLDGTVRKGYGELGRFVNGPEDVEVFPEAVDRIAEWTAAGGRVVAVTNQGGVARGYTSVPHVEDALYETNRLCDMEFSAMCFCPHDPAGSCWCRKPRPGMVFDALAKLQSRWPDDAYPPALALVVGDMDDDRNLAAALGVRFLSARDWRRG